ncbi:alpha/beta-hydrolase [Marasmius fiardii PR-910]|nr:alpha/beta-hydrolase [Marasmius fiardii PR-910]
MASWHWTTIKSSLLVYALANVAYLTGALDLPSSSPHNYSGIPTGPLSPEWQTYFQVTQPLPNITFSLNRHFAGNIPVDRAGHPNNTLFFWAVEKTQGSLTSPAGPVGDSPAPWGIWLNGGPGSSSLAGFLFENGPIRIGSDLGASENKHSWHQIADYFWVDQPVGVGFATADANGYVADEDQIGQDFMGFLSNLVKVFPNLAGRPLHLTGESYAGTYIPYILKAYFGTTNPPVKIGKIAIGDGTLTSGQVFNLAPSIKVLETFPQIIGYDIEVYNYFKEQSDLCGYDLNLTYPQNGHFPTLPLIGPTSRDIPAQLQLQMAAKSFKMLLAEKIVERSQELKARSSRLMKREIENAKKVWINSKRDLIGRVNGSIDPWYGCFLSNEFVDYALNFTYPWSSGDFDVYNVQSAISPFAPMDGTVWLNDNRTRAALHAPIDKDWTLSIAWPFGNQCEPMAFLTDLATNATAKGVSIIVYSGNNDALIPHFGTEVAIQNTTFGGIQGFTKKPSTPWYDDEGNFAGIVHQERGWTYGLFAGAGHLVPADKPSQALTFFREFVFGNNQTGLVQSGSTVVGGEDPQLSNDILPGDPEIYYGSAATQGTYVFPTATRDAWNAFITKQPGTELNTSSNDALGRVPGSEMVMHMLMTATLLPLLFSTL